MRVGRPPLADLGGEATGVLCVEAAALCPAPVGQRGRVPHMEAFQEASPTRRGVDCGIGAGTLSVKGGVWGSRHLVTSSGHFSVRVPFAHLREERVDWLGLSGGLGTSRGPPAFTLQYPRMPLGPSPSRRLP